MELSHASEEPLTEHHVIKRSLWQRWLAWNGSFFIISVLLHILLIGGATFIAVQVVQNRKEKLKFTAPPPSPNSGAEHKVKPSKKTAAAAPAISRRITSTAANASVALPSMDLSSTGPDVMASVMSGLGSSGLGSGAGGAGAGMASMPMSGLTAFGFKAKKGDAGLTGKFFDLKQTPAHQPIKMGANSDHLTPAQYRLKSEHMTLKEFIEQGWNDDYLESRFFRAPSLMNTTQFFIPVMFSVKAPEAFGVEKDVDPSFWVIHYKGNVTASKTTRFRFRGRGDNIIAVRFNNKNVFLNMLQDPNQYLYPLFPDNQPIEPTHRDIVSYGSWIDVQAGKTYPMDVILSDYGGTSSFFLCLEEENTKYDKKVKNPKGVEMNVTMYPLFQLKRDVPLPEHFVSASIGQSGAAIPVETNQDIFNAK